MACYGIFAVTCCSVQQYTATCCLR